MYQKVYNLAINNVIFKKWEEYLMFYDISDRYSNMLWQYIIDRYLLYLVKERKTIQCLPVNEISSEDLKLTAVEENTLRCVSGYIPYSLRQKYLKLKDGVTSRIILSVIEFWCVDPASSSKTFLQYAEKWTSKINREGLINVTNEFYIFVRHVEMSARNILNTDLMKKYGGENIQNLLMSEFKKNYLIDLCWSSITSRIENETLKNTLKSEVLKKWINIRGKCFCFIRNVLFQQKCSMKFYCNILQYFTQCLYFSSYFSSYLKSYW